MLGFVVLGVGMLAILKRQIDPRFFAKHSLLTLLHTFSHFGPSACHLFFLRPSSRTWSDAWRRRKRRSCRCRSVSLDSYRRDPLQGGWFGRFSGLLKGLEGVCWFDDLLISRSTQRVLKIMFYVFQVSFLKVKGYIQR